ncbi:MAG: tRNA (adenosine(37)-N6)-dimethylallyltransferase MiaA [Pseudomonadota bacterium]
MKPKILVICGPTGIGKTGFAIRLAKRFNGEIVGADSMQLYRFMDIGTAKPDARELAEARHHLVGVIDPDQDFDAARYAGMADDAIAGINSRNKVAIVAGGTGFYIKALLHGLFRGRSAEPGIIERLEKQGLEKGPLYLHALLQERDPETAARLHPNDMFRVVRALEVLESTGKCISCFHQDHQFAQSRYTALKLGLTLDRDVLYARIDHRVDLMIQQGLIDEVKRLVAMGYSCDLKSMQSIGYRHVCDFLNKGVSWTETLCLLKRDTRRYAKRQFTWFRKEDGIHWIRPDEVDRAIELVTCFLSSGLERSSKEQTDPPMMHQR